MFSLACREWVIELLEDIYSWLLGIQQNVGPP